MNWTYKLGCMNSIAVGVQTPLINRSNSFVKPAPFPTKWNCFLNTLKGKQEYCIFKYNQQDATLHNLFISVKWCTCFRRFLRPSSGAQNCIYSIGYFVTPVLLPAIVVADSSIGLLVGVYCVLCTAQHTVHTLHQDMLPHHCITNNDVTLLNVLISI